jgi:hypothetical protein
MMHFIRNLFNFRAYPPDSDMARLQALAIAMPFGLLMGLISWLAS